MHTEGSPLFVERGEGQEEREEGRVGGREEEECKGREEPFSESWWGNRKITELDPEASCFDLCPVLWLHGLGFSLSLQMALGTSSLQARVCVCKARSGPGCPDIRADILGSRPSPPVRVGSSPEMAFPASELPPGSLTGAGSGWWSICLPASCR